jgi:CRP/FNR family transcriptional regulator, cyclic AMP receptor protein
MTDDLDAPTVLPSANEEDDVGRKEQQIGELGLFRGCNRRDVDWLASVADTIDLPAGATIALRGARTREFVVIVDGVAAGENEAGHVLLGPGSYFGEMGLIDGRKHSMTITATTPVRAFVFETRVFLSMVERLPGVGRKLMAELVTRLRRAEDADGQKASARNLKAVS